ncbi:DUF1934 domain-containing protein [Bacillus sp. PS06]|uniref:DUF1934 domain-containing protein n=1 Tax=Bacillus sp. PS06 TaxID=2764176 RepID=UPI001784DBA3|nr:DUF1934 domain-containing protein [Bacillus sp. PS06]MBD8071383.1 DUF1934 domain-containing protein [Bacillus sp. PS06]
MSVASDKGTPIQLKFVTEINDQRQKQTVAFQANGQYYIKGNSTYLQFIEPNDLGDVKTIVKIKESEVLILRSGAVTMRQLFRKSETTNGTYQSPAGNMEMLTNTNNVEYKFYNKSHKGHLFLTYTLVLQGEPTGRYTITITFKEEKE